MIGVKNFLGLSNSLNGSNEKTRKLKRQMNRRYRQEQKKITEEELAILQDKDKEVEHERL